MNKLKILNVNFSIGLKTGGGTAERTFQLSRHLAKKNGTECRVLTIKTEDLDQRRINEIYPSQVISLPYTWKRFYIPRNGFSTIDREVKNADIVHIMGHWTILNALVYLSIKKNKKPYVICPAGALPLFGRSKLIKYLYNLIVGKNIVKNANGWIAVTKNEISQFNSYGIESTSVNTIPNGVDINDFQKVNSEEFIKKFNLSGVTYILFMGRLNTIKGPDLLLDSFHNINKEFEQYHLIFAGPDGGMLQELIEKTEKYGLKNKVHFLGHLDGELKLAAYQTAKLLVVPSRQEAMSIVAIESGICSTPVLITDQCGFEEISNIDDQWIVPATIPGLTEGLRNLLNNLDELENNTKIFVSLIKQKYSWSALIELYLKYFDQIIKIK